MTACVYVPVGMVLMSRSVRIPFNRAKSTVCVPFKTETGGLVPSERVMPVMSTRKPTTLGKGASVPVTNTELDCGLVLLEELGLLPQPLSRATRTSAKMPVDHFLRCIGTFSLSIELQKFPRGLRSLPFPWGF